MNNTFFFFFFPPEVLSLFLIAGTVLKKKKIFHRSWNICFEMADVLLFFFILVLNIWTKVWTLFKTLW